MASIAAEVGYVDKRREEVIREEKIRDMRVIALGDKKRQVVSGVIREEKGQ